MVCTGAKFVASWRLSVATTHTWDYRFWCAVCMNVWLRPFLQAIHISATRGALADVGYEKKIDNFHCGNVNWMPKPNTENKPMQEIRQKRENRWQIYEKFWFCFVFLRRCHCPCACLHLHLNESARTNANETSWKKSENVDMKSRSRSRCTMPNRR